MDKFLSDQRVLVFIGAILLALYSWGNGFQTWHDMCTVKAFFSLIGILGSLIAANAGSNIWKTPPTITETTIPKSTVKETITTEKE